MRRALFIAACALACDSGGGVAPSGQSDCPPCECQCDCGDPVVAVDEGGATPPVASANTGDLVASASRKMMHGDGKGCLEDLDEVAALDPKLDARLAVTRGQCEMLVGKCQEGKDRVADWYVRETAMTPERAATTAESLGSMRCRGGDSTDRDRLLAAFFDLSDGAYMNKRDPAFCRQRVEIIRELLPKVPPKDADDAQIKGGGQALFYTAAACYARAEDCKAAYAIYRELFPASGLSAINDPKQREKIVRESFDSSIERCKPKP